MRSFVIAFILLAAEIATATSNGNGNNPSISTSASASAVATARAESDSTSIAVAGGGRGGDGGTARAFQSFTDRSTTRYAFQPVPTAAALPGGFCTSAGLSGQFKDVGFSATGADRFCKRIELADRYFSVALNMTALRSALAAEYGDGKGKGVRISDSAFEALVRESQAKGFEQLKAAEDEMALAENPVRRFFSRVLGSLPVLAFLAP